MHKKKNTICETALTGIDFDDWREAASCVGTDPEVFFPDKGDPGTLAKQVCRMCVVRVECLKDAIDTDEPYGIRGGLTSGERASYKARRASGRPINIEAVIDKATTPKRSKRR